MAKEPSPRPKPGKPMTLEDRLRIKAVRKPSIFDPNHPDNPDNPLNPRRRPDEQERQLIHCVRQLKDADEFGLTIKREAGAWEIGMSAGPSPKHPRQIRSRGVGRTFGEAWDNITGLVFDRPDPKRIKKLKF